MTRASPPVSAAIVTEAPALKLSPPHGFVARSWEVSCRHWKAFGRTCPPGFVSCSAHRASPRRPSRRWPSRSAPTRPSSLSSMPCSSSPHRSRAPGARPRRHRTEPDVLVELRGHPVEKRRLRGRAGQPPDDHDARDFGRAGTAQRSDHLRQTSSVSSVCPRRSAERTRPADTTVRPRGPVGPRVAGSVRSVSVDSSVNA